MKIPSEFTGNRIAWQCGDLRSFDDRDPTVAAGIAVGHGPSATFDASPAACIEEFNAVAVVIQLWHWVGRFEYRTTPYIPELEEES